MKSKKSTPPLLRSSSLALVVALLLLGALPMGVVAAPPSAHPHASLVLAQGYIVSQEGSAWRVGVTPVRVDASTRIDETKGQAVKGAHVSIEGLLDESNTILARVVTVNVPFGALGPIVELSGVVLKITSTKDSRTNQTCYNYVIGGQPVFACPPETVIDPKITVGWVVWAVVVQEQNQLRALAIDGLASSPSGLPVEFEGRIEAIQADRWVVDGRVVIITPDTVILGDPEVGMTGEVRALSGPADLLTGLVLRAVDPASEAYVNALLRAIGPGADGSQNWDVTLFTGQGNELRAEPGLVRVDPKTYVEERRASLRTGLYAEITGQNLGGNQIKAELVHLDRPWPVTVTGVLEPVAGLRSGQFWTIDGQRVWSDAQSTRQALQTAISGAGRVTIRGLRLGNGLIWVQDIAASAAGSR